MGSETAVLKQSETCLCNRMEGGRGGKENGNGPKFLFGNLPQISCFPRALVVQGLDFQNTP
jgi:hypothetical protein